MPPAPSRVVPEALEGRRGRVPAAQPRLPEALDGLPRALLGVPLPWSAGRDHPFEEGEGEEAREPQHFQDERAEGGVVLARGAAPAVEEVVDPPHDLGLDLLRNGLVASGKVEPGDLGGLGPRRWTGGPLSFPPAVAMASEGARTHGLGLRGDGRDQFSSVQVRFKSGKRIEEEEEKWRLVLRTLEGESGGLPRALKLLCLEGEADPSSEWASLDLSGRPRRASSTRDAISSWVFPMESQATKSSSIFALLQGLSLALSLPAFMPPAADMAEAGVAFSVHSRWWSGPRLPMARAPFRLPEATPLSKLGAGMVPTFSSSSFRSARRYSAGQLVPQ